MRSTSRIRADGFAPGAGGGRYRHSLPSNQTLMALEARRTNRWREALRRKCPNRQRCKEGGARTVLVLESDDIVLTDHVLVGECLAALLPECPDPPDEICPVETEVGSWAVRCMKLDTECWPVEHSVELAMFQMDAPIDLCEATTT